MALCRSFTLRHFGSLLCCFSMTSAMNKGIDHSSHPPSLFIESNLLRLSQCHWEHQRNRELGYRHSIEVGPPILNGY